jgi:tight adherence protein C
MASAVLISGFLAVLMLVIGGGGLVLTLLRPERRHYQDIGLGEGPLSRFVLLLADWNRRRPALAATMVRLDRRLLLAGRPLGNGGGAEWIAILELIGVGITLLFVGLLMLVGNGLLLALVSSVGVGLVCVGLGAAWLESLIHDRERAISRQYPYFLDLAVMTMEAGSIFQESVDVYIRGTAADPLRDELLTARRDLELGLSEKRTLSKLRERISSEDVRDSIHIIIQGLSAGTSLTRLLRDQAEGLRFRRSQMAERVAEELKIRLLGPATMMMASVIVLILGPVLVNVSSSGIF